MGGQKSRKNKREKFGGINGGKARYALVDNDVGPLEPGRIIDLNERTMRYFDSTLQRGLIPNVKVTPLRGDHWTPGPIASGDSRPVPFKPRPRSAQDSNRSNHQQPEWKYAQTRNGLQSQSRQ